MAATLHVPLAMSMLPASHPGTMSGVQSKIQPHTAFLNAGASSSFFPVTQIGHNFRCFSPAALRALDASALVCTLCGLVKRAAVQLRTNHIVETGTYVEPWCVPYICF